MKKYVIMLVGILSFIGVSTVKADTLSFSNYYEQFDVSLDLYYQYENEINNLISIWDENYSNDYPYYFIQIINSDLFLTYSSSNLTKWDDDGLVVDNISGNIVYNVDNSSVRYNWYAYILPLLSYNTYRLHSSIINHGFVYTNNPDSWSSGGNTYSSDFDTILFPDFTSSVYTFTNSSFEIEEGDYIPAYLDLYNGSYSPTESNTYQEINLNNYSYVSLSLKDYTEREEFYTNVEVQGQYCLTPVYDYGLKEKKDVITGSKVQACSPYYDNFTPVRTYILESDIKNHAIYYLKAYDTSRDNKVKVDTSVFNIHYITSEEADNPILNINGRNYTTIPYDNLSDSATISEEEGYVSGASCAVGDINCTHDVLGGHSITDIFNKPLEFFKNLIESFVSVFELVTSLIAVLPLPMQWFLYLSFTLAIALGIIKIIL